MSSQRARTVDRASLPQLCATGFLLILCSGSPLGAAPLPTRDQNPLLVARGIPMPLSARAATEGWTVAGDINWASTALVQSDADELLVVDAETREIRITLERRLGDRWFTQFQLPYRDLSGGSLDGFIDNWHDVFGLPAGARPQQPQDRLRVRYAQDGSLTIVEDDSQAGLADATAAIGYQMLSSPTSAVRAAVSIDLPIGENHWFLTSDAVEASALIAAEHRFNDAWSVYGQGAVTWLEQGGLLEDQQRNVVWSGQTALSWQATQAVALVMQVEAHSKVFDQSDLDFFQDALILSVGGRYAITPNWSLNIGVSEDIAVEQSPDVVFVFGVTRRSGH